MSASGRTRRVTSSAAAIPANAERHVGPVENSQTKHDAGSGPPGAALLVTRPRVTDSSAADVSTASSDACRMSDS